LYSCQVVTEKLSRAAVVERAAKLADAEGVEAVTIRRLAQELGVTPMALYWHFKNKEELIFGLVDHLLAEVTATRRPEDPPLTQLRAMVETLVAAMREHPSLAGLLHMKDQGEVPSLTRATEDALELLARIGYTDVREGYAVASYLLHGAIGLVSTEPGCPTFMNPEQAIEWRRQKRRNLEALPAAEYPMLTEFASTVEQPPDLEHYYTFGIDMLMRGVGPATS
jgi:TetR/AcrR family tetracycline transcriptional repressor